jgi:putative transposase
MRNHVHFIVIPWAEDSLARTFNVAHMRYSQYFNKRLKQSGHLWQGRFYSCVLDEPHLFLAIRYIERNPVRKKMVKVPWQWRWSSASAHTGMGESILKLSDFSKIVDISSKSWKAYIDSAEDEEKLNKIRKFILTGRPLGSVAFIEGLEKEFDRKLGIISKGRPKMAEK